MSSPMISNFNDSSDEICFPEDDTLDSKNIIDVNDVNEQIFGKSKEDDKKVISRYNQNKYSYLIKGSISSDVFEIINDRNKKIIQFTIKTVKNRGRHISSNSHLIKKHKRTDSDNILTKIQVHFINFLIDLANEALNVEFYSNFLVNRGNNPPDFKFNSNPDYFRYINYKYKKKIDYNYMTNIFQSPIKNIIIQNISKKYKTLKNFPNYNKQLYDLITEKSNWFKEFLDIKFIEVFNRYYYNNEKPLDKIYFKGKKITISKKTQSFYYLLQNNDLAELIINSVKSVYVDTYNKSNLFKTIKNNN